MGSGRMLFPMFGLVALAACAGPATDDTRTQSEAGGTLASTPADPAAVRRTIDSVNANAVAALKGKDAATLASHYDPEGASLMSNMPAWKGKSAIEQNAKGMFEGMDIKDFKINTDDVVVSGDLAVETGTYEMTYTPKGAKEVSDKGKFVTVWRRQSDGSWKIFRDISNSDLEMK